MYNKYQVSIKFLLQLSKTKKAFLLFDHKEGKITNYIFTNDLTRYRNLFDSWKLNEIIQPQLLTLTIEI
jgi:hypothetical protein